jgi:hypothetical protein
LAIEPSGKPLFKLGGTPSPVSVTLENANSEELLGGQHDANFVENYLYVFDNGNNQERPARGLKIELHQAVDGRWNGSVVAEYVDPRELSSVCTGSIEAADELVLVGWGCSKNGFTVFSDDSSAPLFSAWLEESPTNSEYLTSPLGLEELRYSFGYRVRFSDETIKFVESSSARQP